jgi:hypothetical protein
MLLRQVKKSDKVIHSHSLFLQYLDLCGILIMICSLKVVGDNEVIHKINVCCWLNRGRP